MLLAFWPKERSGFAIDVRSTKDGGDGRRLVFSTLRDKLFTAVVGDVLDKMGWRRQFLPQAIGPLTPEMKVIGRAMPVLEADIFDEGSRSRGGVEQNRSGSCWRRSTIFNPNEVYVATGGSLRYAFWGELMSTRARFLRAAGAVLNGFVRDADGIEALGFPTFSRGLYAQDQGPRGKVIDFRVASRSKGSGSRPAISSSAIARGCWSFLPKSRAEAIEAALAKASTENKVATAIRGGMGAREAFETYGVRNRRTWWRPLRRARPP